MAWFGHDYLRVSNGFVSEVLPWNSNGNNWRNSKDLLYRVNLTYYLFRWQIYDYEQGGVVSVSTTSFYGSNTPDPTSLTFNNSWVVSETSGGAQGDPHITPLFGNKYTK